MTGNRSAPGATQGVGGMERLRGVVRAYDWGQTSAIAELLGHEPPGHPEAEYWLGAHPSGPSVLSVSDRSLDRLVADRGPAVLGPVVHERFHELPFLLKVLAADRPLSIQAHPNAAQARAGFSREEAAGLGRSAPERSYRDDKHKPELICAITPFEAKCGFRPLAGTRQLIALFGPALRPVADRLSPPTSAESDAAVLAGVVEWLLRLSPVDAAVLAGAAADRARELLAGADGPPAFRSELVWTVRIAEAFPGDIGTVVTLLLNHLSLAPGQAVFLGAGDLHSYLQGVGVELMANSDNVLRGGLTSKHIDVDELLAIIDCRPRAVAVQTPTAAVHRFDTPVPEFGLTRFDSSVGTLGPLSCNVAGPEILLVTAGRLAVECGERILRIGSGEAVFIPYDDHDYHLTDLAPGRTLAWRATVGLEGTARG